MALLFRTRASRHYAIASGVLFCMAAVVIGVLSIIAPRSGMARLIGLALAALLASRGLFRIRQARTNAAAGEGRESGARASR